MNVARTAISKENGQGSAQKSQTQSVVQTVHDTRSDAFKTVNLL
ncbi:hypothetical protein JCM19235_414 [Vibrio maritimus]|uniref:Uncharacterized protein n=1 Tax=Vibrio maritimus TaxID=990268 RepID=A0A090S3Q9_9VIBR|nr:hypothetical protein JCM19235_414 [Vibrio maritimus]